MQTLAARTRVEYEGALSLIRPTTSAWRPRALLVSALEEKGIEEIWQTIREHRDALEASGLLETRRRKQNRDWMWSLVDQGLRREMHADPDVAHSVSVFEEEVEAQKRTPAAAARELLSIFRGKTTG
jgi:LAO/AO transport system kinase